MSLPLYLLTIHASTINKTQNLFMRQPENGLCPQWYTNFTTPTRSKPYEYYMIQSYIKVKFFTKQKRFYISITIHLSGRNTVETITQMTESFVFTCSGIKLLFYPSIWFLV